MQIISCTYRNSAPQAFGLGQGSAVAPTCFPAAELLNLEWVTNLTPLPLPSVERESGVGDLCSLIWL